jgi:signal transduction histidine kinase/ActR/RegA family two-component response regulator
MPNWTSRRSSSEDRARPRLDATIVAAAMILMTALGVAGVWQVSMSALSRVESEHLAESASHIAGSIDPALVRAAVSDPRQIAPLAGELRRVLESSDRLARITIFVADGNSARVIAEASRDSQRSGPERLLGDSAAVGAMVECLGGERVATLSDPRPVEGSRVISSFVPISDSRTARGIAGMGIDVSADAMMQDQAAAARRALVGLIPCLVGSLGMGFIVYRLRSRERADHRRMERSRHVAEAANRAKSDFLSNMSHEIRTPMTVVVGYSELLEDDDLALESRREYVRNIQRAGNHLVELINDILDVSKIEAGKVELHRTWFNPGALLDEVDSIMRQRAQSKSLALEFVGRERLPDRVLSDPMRLRQILVNLIGNAIKFTERGGVTVTCAFHHDELGNRVEFAIADTGIGMDREVLRRLFRPFEQGDSSTTRRFGGTGLGLFICQRLATMLGGSIEVESEAGVGSTFRLWIEALKHDAEKPPVAASAPSRDESSRAASLSGRILLADDGIDNRRLISHILSHAGAVVDTAVNGRELLERVWQAEAESKPYALVLADMQMPELDGYSAVRELRRRGHRGVVVALTAHAMGEHRQRCLDAGCDDFITKPFQRRDLIERCRKWIASGRVSPNANAPEPSNAP